MFSKYNNKPEYEKLRVPFDISSIIERAKGIKSGKTLTDKDRAHVEESMRSLTNLIITLFGNTQGKAKREIVLNAIEYSIDIINMYLSSKQIIKEYKLTDEALRAMIDDIYVRMEKAMIKAGTMYGVSSGGSMTEVVQQGTLNSFHKSGKGDAALSLGKARMTQILAVTDTPKCINEVRMFIYLKPEFTKSKDVLEKITAQFIHYKMKSFIKSITVPNEKVLPADVQSAIDSFIRQKGKMGNSIVKYPIIFRFSDEKLYYKKIELQTIYIKIKEFAPESTVITNGKNLIIVYASTNDIQEYGKYSTLYKNFEYFIELVPEIDISGYIGIKSIDIHKDSQGNDYLFAVGTNIAEVMKNPRVLRERTYSIDINETWTNFGLCAAINIIYKNLVMIFTENGGNVNYGALKMLANMMCSNGTIAAIDSTGLAKIDASVLQRVVFERPFGVLTDAAKYGLSDNMTSPMSNIIHAQSFKGGTGLCDIVVS